MTAQSRPTLKSYFEVGDRPTQAQFADLLDSFARVGTVANPTSEIVLYPGASSTAPISYAGAMPYWKSTSSGSQENCVSQGMYAKGRDGSLAAGLYFGVSGNYGRETMMYLETTGVTATCNRQISFEPGFSSTSQFPSIRSEGIGTFATDPNISFGILARGTGYVGFHTRANGGYHGMPGGGDVLQAFVTDTSGAAKQIQMTGGDTAASPRVFANSGTVSNVNLHLGSQGSGNVSIFTDAKTYSNNISGTDIEALRIVHVASADNFISINPSPNSLPTIRAISNSNANVSIGICAQGASNVNFFTGTTTLQGRFTNTTGAVNTIDITGAVSGSPVGFTAQGEADVGIRLTPRGSAYVQYGTFVSDAGNNVTGHIKIRTADGTIRRLAIVSGT